MDVLVTGGCGFIGSEFVRHWIRGGRGRVHNVDALTYAGSPARVDEAARDPAYRFHRLDVAHDSEIRALMAEARPDAVVHFAAESHVTRSESDPDTFYRTNVEGTRVLLDAARAAGVPRFLHVSTDEVYGSASGDAFRETDKAEGTAQATSPYAKSKSAADDLARAASGDGMRVVVARPTNCFGPWQYPEKALPRWIARALGGRPLPVWGDGLYVRQWLFVSDLVAALEMLLTGDPEHDVYNVGPRHEPEITNVALARWLAGHLDLPDELVVHTPYDRPDHDRRYAVDPARIEALGWRGGEVWEEMAATVRWYRDNRSWWEPLVPEAESIYEDEVTT